MSKKYEYDNLIYCEDDLSEEIDNYGGDLYDLFWKLKEDRECEEYTIYHPLDSSRTYDTAEDMIEDYFDFLEVKGEQYDILKKIKELEQDD